MENLQLALKQWIKAELGAIWVEMEPLKGDASFRTYYRVFVGDKSYIAMLAPVENENTRPFVHIARAWGSQGIPVPTVFAWDPARGFVLLSDFGDALLQNSLTAKTVDGYYHAAMQILLSLQQVTAASLPHFDEKAIALELSYFEDWFLKKLLGINTEKIKASLLEPLFTQLMAACVSQEQVIVHRDYHSRNIMLKEDASLGIIDFQDAVIGPITYDLVSLLKDCYVSWPIDQVMTWVTHFYEELKAQGRLIGVELKQFYQGFHLVGLQRHLKVLGIFSRLKLRDHKPQYIDDMPRIMNYVLQVTSSYEDFAGFHQWLQDEVMPPLQRVWDEAKSRQVA